MRGLVERAWIPLVLVVVLAVCGLIVMRLHKIFGSQGLNANAGAGIEIVQFNARLWSMTCLARQAPVPGSTTTTRTRMRMRSMRPCRGQPRSPRRCPR
jgi:hypothetical protein